MSYRQLAALLASCVLAPAIIAGCANQSTDKVAANSATPSLASYFDTTGRTDTYAGGVRMIPITTPKGTFNVWTKRVGNNPTVKLLLLHGGPGVTHEYFEAADAYLPAAGVEYYYYDQLGSYNSDQPKDSWGGILATEYALKYGQNLKGLIISNMMASIPAYNRYADSVLMPAMNQQVLAEVKAIEAKKDYANPRYMELLIPNHYEQHILRKPAAQWPEPVNRTFKHMNPDIYIPMQGPSELGASGKLVNWDRTADLKNITVPTLVIAGTYDTMDPKHMEWMSTQFPKGRYLLCPNAGHMAMYDDGPTYFGGLITFMNDVAGGTFTK